MSLGTLRESPALIPHDSDLVFTGSVAELYDQLLVPLIFEPYAADLVERLRRVGPRSVLEVAAGTGVVTRAMAEGLDASTRIVGSDLNQPMIDHAIGIGTARPVEWRQADVSDLPFGDGTFDAVVCQFGVMFFPDKVRALSEIRRILRPGGTLLFNTWDRIETNEFAAVVTDSLAELFPDDPPRFLARTPHGYHEEEAIQKDIVDAGFATPASFEPVEGRSRADSPTSPAIAYCQGTPLRDEIEARHPNHLNAATSIAAEAIAQRFGRSDLDGRIRGFVVTAGRP